MEPLAGVVITSREIYDAVVRLTGRVDVLIAQQEQARYELQDHESRLRSMERSRWPLPTVTVLIALASLGYAVLIR